MTLFQIATLDRATEITIPAEFRRGRSVEEQLVAAARLVS